MNPCARIAAFKRVIHNRRKLRFFFRRFAYAERKAFMFCWFAVLKSNEAAPRKPFVNFNTFLCLFLETFPRFTRVIFEKIEKGYFKSSEKEFFLFVWSMNLTTCEKCIFFSFFTEEKICFVLLKTFFRKCKKCFEKWVGKIRTF